MLETIVSIPIDKLHDFPQHPFSVRSDNAMAETAESIRAYGVLVPAIVRPLEDGSYEIISGHRRKHACQLLGLDSMPCIVRNLDDDAATIIMVDSNLQRENILPSERAAAYKMKLEAIRRRAGRPGKNNRDQVGPNFDNRRSTEIIAAESGESMSQVKRFIRLTELEPELQTMVDEGRIGLTPAVEISYLSQDEQRLLLDTIDSEQSTPSLSQAQRIRRLSKDGNLNEDTMLTIMMEQKKPIRSTDITLSGDRLRRFFPKTYTPQRIEDTIYKLLDAWSKKRQRDQNR